MDLSTRLRGINPTNTVFYSPQPRAEVYCLLMNFKISKLAYSTRTLVGMFSFSQDARVTQACIFAGVNVNIARRRIQAVWSIVVALNF